MQTVCTLVNCAALFYGGLTDYRRREIPNAVPLLLLLTGILRGTMLSYRLLAMLVIILALYLAERLTGERAVGGDCKLLCTLTFSTGLITAMSVLLLAGIGAALVGFARGLPMRRSIPLCTYAAPAYMVTQVYLLTFLFQ